MEVLATSIARYREVTRYASRIGASLVRDDRKLRLTHRVKHRGVHGFRRALACPHHELERREVAFTGVDSTGEHRFALRSGGSEPARQHQRLAVHHHAGAGPQIEMANPQLLVD